MATWLAIIYKETEMGLYCVLCGYIIIVLVIGAYLSEAPIRETLSYVYCFTEKR